MATPDFSTPGATYKFTAKSAAEAALAIRERLGPDARVLSVRTVEAGGLRGLWSSPRIEVTAQVAAVAPAEAEGRAAPPGPPIQHGEPNDPAGQETARPAVAPYHRRGGPSGAALPLETLLRRSGLSEVALARLQSAPVWKELVAAPLHRALVEAGRRLQAELQAGGRRTPLRRAAFLGSAGSGRTTVLCKWLGAEVFRRGRTGRVITVEFDRPNPPGALPLFCEALGVPVLRHPASPHLESPGDFVAYDLPSFSVSHPEANTALGEFLDREGVTDRVLVINAAYDHAILRSAYAAGRALGATHLVFTHLDEMAQWGRLWDYLFDPALQPLFLANGPSLTGDCETDVFGALIRRTLAAAPADDEESAVPAAAAFSP